MPVFVSAFFPGNRLAGPADTLLWGHGAHVTRIDGVKLLRLPNKGSLLTTL
jgi:hypothetical protein